MLICIKTQLHPPLLSSDITQDLANLLFWVMQTCLAMPSRLIGSTCTKVWCLSACKKNQLHSSVLFWDTNIFKLPILGTLGISFLHPFLRYKKLQISYFGYFRHIWLWPVKMTLSACRKLWFSSCKKSYLSLISFLKYYKDIANLLFLVLWGMPSYGTTLLETANKNQTKIKFISQFFLEILNFKECWNLTDQEHFGWKRKRISGKEFCKG